MTILAALLLLTQSHLALLPVACIIDGAPAIHRGQVIVRNGSTIIMRARTASACVRLGGIALERLE